MHTADGTTAELRHVFISYVTEDADAVLRLTEALEARGVPVWLDRKSLSPGAVWPSEIARAIREGMYFIACFSARSEEKGRSYMREELDIALAELRRRPFDAGWFIPVLLSDCLLPDLPIGGGRRLTDVHYVDLRSDWEVGVAQLAHKIMPQPEVEDSADALTLVRELWHLNSAVQRVIDVYSMINTSMFRVYSGEEQRLLGDLETHLASSVGRALRLLDAEWRATEHAARSAAVADHITKLHDDHSDLVRAFRQTMGALESSDSATVAVARVRLQAAWHECRAGPLLLEDHIHTIMGAVLAPRARAEETEGAAPVGGTSRPATDETSRRETDCTGTLQVDPQAEPPRNDAQQR